MKVSEIGVATMANQVRIDPDYLTAEDKDALAVALAAAVDYVKSYTGMDAEEMDEHEDITVAVLVLVSDMFDNRAMTWDKYRTPNRTVETILGMHCKNLMG